MAVSRNHKIIRGALVLDAAEAAVHAADVLVDGDRIAEIGAPGMDAPDDAAVIDASNKLIIPGLINAHTHTHGALAKGRGDKWSLEMLLNANPWLSGGLNEEEKYISGQLNAAEMVLKGCTATYDMFFEAPMVSPEGFEAAARGYADIGVRAVMAPMMADTTFYRAIPGLLEAFPEPLREKVAAVQASPYEEQLRVCRQIYENWSFDRDRVRPAIAPTIPLHCSDDFLAGCRDLAKEYGLGIQMHLAESKVQAVSGLKKYGKTLAAHLDDLGVLGPNFTGAHCVWLTGDDIKRLADHGASVAHNPGANLRLGSGIAAAKPMRTAGLNVGIGTDGSMCSDNQNVFEAMRMAEFVSRTTSLSPDDWLGTWDILTMATEGGAAALGFDGLLGRIAPGYKADLVFLDLSSVNYVPLNDAANQLVNSEDSSAVNSVMIGGRMVLENRRFTEFDFETLSRKAQEAASRLLAANREIRENAEALEEFVVAHCIGLASENYHVQRRIDAADFI